MEKLLNLTSKNSINNVGLSVEATAEFLLETNFELIYDLFTQNCPYWLLKKEKFVEDLIS